LITLFNIFTVEDFLRILTVDNVLVC